MNERLFVWKDKKTRTGSFAGVVLEVLKDDWVHVGLLYRTETSGGAYVLHLKGHNLLRHDPPTKGQICVLPRIEPVRLPALAAFARNIYRKNKDHGIPYAFTSPDHEWFSPEGQLLLGPERLGLTCANFILALYRAAGLPLIKLETWPARKEDKAWQSSVIAQWTAAVKGNRRKLRHLARMKKEIGTVRCRPVEIGGAALSDEIPCDYTKAKDNSHPIEVALGLA